MTTQPSTVGPGETLATARRMMRDHGIRHLPVLDGGTLVGVVSHRDLYASESLVGPGANLVSQAMTHGAYPVAPHEPIGRVAGCMARRQFDCAVVVEQGRVVGIFTVTDALSLIERSAGADTAG